MRHVVLLLVGVGCGLYEDEDSFLDRFPEDMCERGQVCLWPDVPPDRAVCVDERLAVLDELDRCDSYDGEAAARCLQEIRTLPCDASEYQDPTLLPDPCDEVYVCPTSTLTSY